MRIGQRRVELLDGAEAGVLAFMSFPKEHRTQIHPTIPLECVHKEIKRSNNVVGLRGLIPTGINQNPWAHFRRPIDMIFQG